MVDSYVELSNLRDPDEIFQAPTLLHIDLALNMLRVLMVEGPFYLHMLLNVLVLSLFKLL